MLVPTWLPPADYSRYKRTTGQARTIVGIDLDQPSLHDNELGSKACSDLASLPFPSATFDLITANMVVEHLDAPGLALREIRRVLKDDGVFVFLTPNLMSPALAFASLLPDWLKRHLARFLEKREEEDVFPALYRLNTRAQIQNAAVQAGLRIREVKTVSTAPLTQYLGPVVVFELLAARLLQLKTFAPLRPDIVAILEVSREAPKTLACSAVPP